MKIERTHPCYDLLLFLYQRAGATEVGKKDMLFVLSMEKASSIEDMIAIYDKVLQKIVTYSKEEMYFPNTWWFLKNYWPEQSMKLWQQLDFLLNQSIQKLFDASDHQNARFCRKCIINLRYSTNYEEIFHYMVSRSPKSVQLKKEELLVLIYAINPSLRIVAKNYGGSFENKKTVKDYLKAIKKAENIGFVQSMNYTACKEKMKGIGNEQIKQLIGICLILAVFLLVALPITNYVVEFVSNPLILVPLICFLLAGLLL